MLLMLRGQQILEIEKFDYTRNPESRKFQPVQIKGMKEVPQYPAEPLIPSNDRRGSNDLVAAPIHYTEAHVLPTPAKSSGREVVRHVDDDVPQAPAEDYAGPTVKQINKPGI